MRTTMVTGASRGIGLELVRQSLERGDRVVAVTRSAAPPLDALVRAHGDRLVHVIADLGDEAAIIRSRAEVAGRVDGIDLLVNNAGLYSTRVRSWNPDATRLDTVTQQELVEIFRVNAAGPIVLVRHYLDLLRRGSRILNISSLSGSVGAKTSAGDYAYSASKAALNIMTRALAAELAPRGIIVIAITPAWVRTEMGGADASLGPEESVRGMLAVADRLTAADAGRFVDYAGEDQPW